MSQAYSEHPDPLAKVKENYQAKRRARAAELELSDVAYLAWFQGLSKEEQIRELRLVLSIEDPYRNGMLRAELFEWHD